MSWSLAPIVAPLPFFPLDRSCPSVLTLVCVLDAPQPRKLKLKRQVLPLVFPPNLTTLRVLFDEGSADQRGAGGQLSAFAALAGLGPTAADLLVTFAPLQQQLLQELRLRWPALTQSISDDQVDELRGLPNLTSMDIPLMSAPLARRLLRAAHCSMAAVR